MIAATGGETVEVLIERGRAGRSQHYAEVRLDRGDYAPGDVARATVTAAHDGNLLATPLNR